MAMAMAMATADAVRRHRPPSAVRRPPCLAFSPSPS